MPFLALAFDLGANGSDAAEAACFAAGAVSVTFSDARDDAILEPLPGEFRLWPATRLEALFPEGTDAGAAVAVVSALLGVPAAGIAVRVVEDRPWEREWLKDFHAMRFGRRLWVCPRHESVDDAGAVIVRLDPGLAFGTGTHATTALCLEWLDRNLDSGWSVIDYGCGSGILAVAAALLGAANAACFDIDPQALTATGDNAATNGVGARIRICTTAAELPRAVDCLVANILSGPLCDLAPQFAGRVRPGGRVVLAGLMAHETAEVTRAYAPWFDMAPFGERDGWVGLEGMRRS